MGVLGGRWTLLGAVGRVVVGWWGEGRMMGDGSGYRGGGWAWFSDCREVVDGNAVGPALTKQFGVYG